MTAPASEFDGATLLHGDCIEVMASMPDCSVDAVVTDPPYGLEFMGKEWDAPWKNGVHAEARSRRADELGDESKRSFIAAGVNKYQAGPEFQAWCESWAVEALRVLKPGGHLVAFGGTRTYHRLTAGLEDAGFEIRDCLAWLYGSGFPKSHNVSKALDRAGFESESARWGGWGTALKPAFEPAVLARKPLGGTVAANVLEHGTGALNIDGCRIVDEGGGSHCPGGGLCSCSSRVFGATKHPPRSGGSVGRFPANVALDIEAAGMLDEAVGDRRSGSRRAGVRKGLGYHGARGDGGPAIEASSGGPSRFFYCSKASRKERRGSEHPTVKPLDLMRWLVRLVTPPGGVVLDPFAGSGTTGEAARAEGFDVILIERDGDYLGDIRTRLANGDIAKG